MARVTGVGGVFFKSRGKSAELAAWYRKHLGMPLEDFGGAILKWPEDQAEDQGLTVWHVADSDSSWFSPQAVLAEAGSRKPSIFVGSQQGIPQLPEPFPWRRFSASSAAFP